MKRRTFIQACMAALAAPAAIGKAEMPDWDWKVVKTPDGRRRLSAEEVDEFCNLTLERLRRQKFAQLAEDVETYMWTCKKCEGAPIAIDYWGIH